MIYGKVCVINGYAGSLTVAAHQAGLKVVASLEDCGYGLDAQRANFPNLTYVEREPWPAADLRDTPVIAHPPCAAFSMQNNNPKAKGLDTAHFDCTRAVLRYAAENQSPAIMIESVPGAYEGARNFYDHWCQGYLYDCYRILQNAVTFGVPQWRPRYWTVLIKRGRLDHTWGKLILRHRRLYRTIEETLGGWGYGLAGEQVPWLERKWTRQLQFLNEGGLNNTEIEELAGGGWGYGPLVRLLATRYDLTREEAQERFHISNYQADGFKVLDPNGYTSTLMWDSAWLWHGRPCTVPEYNVLAGFPADYKFPKLRMQGSYLSKGVAPPVARWLLDNVRANLEDKTIQGMRGIDPRSWPQDQRLYEVSPGGTADLRVTKKEAYAKTP
jgi:site-specific DNA-cytosine methylase